MSKIKCTTLANASDSKSVPVDTVVQGTAKAWVNFNGTGTVAIRAAFNVSSITDNGTGNYTVNFATPMPDINFCVASNVNGDSADISTCYVTSPSLSDIKTTTQYQTRTRLTSPSVTKRYDAPEIGLVFHT